MSQISITLELKDQIIADLVKLTNYKQAEILYFQEQFKTVTNISIKVALKDTIESTIKEINRLHYNIHILNKS